MNWKIPLFKIYTDEDDVKETADVIRSGMNWATGPKVAELEDLVARYVGTKYAVTLNSGTSALHAVLLAYGIGSGDEVIVPSFTFIATANAPFFAGARPVFADIEEETLGLNPDDVAEKITPKTRAILPIHYGGIPCKINELHEIAEDHNLLLIEDAAEAFGAKIGKKKIGTYGDSAMFSFCQNKIITTGEGGAIVTGNKKIFSRLELIRSHGRPESKDYFSSNEAFDYVSLGYNFRLSNISAALGISQMKKVEKLIGKRRSHAAYYTKKISEKIPSCTIMRETGDSYSVCQLFSIRIQQRDLLMKFLEGSGVMSKVYFSPVHKTKFYNQVLGYDCSLPVTESVAGDILSLPMYPGITRREIDFIVNQIKKFSGLV